MTGGYPIDGKPKEKSEKMHPGIWKLWLVFLIAVVAIIAVMAAVFMGSTPNSTSPGLGGPLTNGQQPVIGPTNPSQVNAGQETIIDRYGNQVNQENIIDVGKIAVVSTLEQPTHLVRNGLIDIQVNYRNDIKMVEIIATEIPNPNKKQTFARVKVFDDKGLVSFKGENGQSVDYIEMQLGSKGASKTIFPEDVARPMKGYVKELAVLIYFVDTKSIPASLNSANKKKQI